eukprot:TRINITY_DN6122_c0_g1_i6.p1 TRINITY_DN6122_c0_g1~~TRINITY_DN6122_c0_g1_i6.p1  ORF type:complete len:496 (-),score=54.97 TRINITY_DN6122_c0_g1_i6:66-1466(-)
MDVAICLFLACCLGVDFGINKPSVQPYIETPKTSNPPGLGEDSTFYSVVVACYSVGEFFGAIVFGGLTSSPLGHKWVFYLSTVIGVIGGCCYTFAAVGWMALIGRILQGIWAGAINASIRAFVTKTTSKPYVGRFVTTITFLATFFVLNSSGAAGLMGGVNIIYGDIRFDEFRGPGWILIALGVFTLFVTLLFRETYEEGVKEAAEAAQAISVDNFASEEKQKSGCVICVIPDSVNRPLLVSIVLIFFAFSVGLSLNETILTPLSRDCLGMSVEKTATVFLAGGITNGVGFPILLVLQRYFPKQVSSVRVTFFALFLCFGACVIWTDWAGAFFPDPCQQHTCTFSLNSSVVCPPDKTMEACESSSPQCSWMTNTTYGPCLDCPPVCRNLEKTLSVYQLYSGNMLLAIGFTMGRAASSAFYSELLQGRAQGLLMGLLIATGSFARIVAPLIGVLLWACCLWYWDWYC